MQQRIINLGKELVKELGLDPGVDTLSRWMAHYIAEHIELAESLRGDEKEEARRQCFETILKLWQHRAAFPGGHRPFEKFEPIFKILERLDPENHQSFFFRADEKNLSLNPQVKQWSDMALDVDRVARVWIEYILQQAVLHAEDKRTKKWLKNAIGSEDEARVIDIIFSGEDGAEKKCERIKSKIEQLKAFDKFNKKLLLLFEKELTDLTNENKTANTRRSGNKKKSQT
jgi:hypothetical protein